MVDVVRVLGTVRRDRGHSSGPSSGMPRLRPSYPLLSGMDRPGLPCYSSSNGTGGRQVRIPSQRPVDHRRGISSTGTGVGTDTGPDPEKVTIGVHSSSHISLGRGEGHSLRVSSH